MSTQPTPVGKEVRYSLAPLPVLPSFGAPDRRAKVSRFLARRPGLALTWLVLQRHARYES